MEGGGGEEERLEFGHPPEKKKLLRTRRVFFKTFKCYYTCSELVTRSTFLLLSSTLPDSICQREITLNLCLCCNEKAKRERENIF